MSFADIDRRLRRIEADRQDGAPTRVMADRPMDEDEIAEALTDWRAWLRDGRATAGYGILCVLAPEMTVETWEAVYAQERETLPFTPPREFYKNPAPLWSLNAFARRM